jgi:hypothetical protein
VIAESSELMRATLIPSFAIDEILIPSEALFNALKCRLQLKLININKR